jgi:hypothetical protein
LRRRMGIAVFNTLLRALLCRFAEYLEFGQASVAVAGESDSAA